MPVPTDPIAALVVGALALGLGTLGAWVFLRAGLPGGKRAAGIVGGLVVGVLGGQGLIGAISPSTYDAWIIGGVTEQGVLHAHDEETDAQIVAMGTIGVSAAAIYEHGAERAATRAPLEEDLLEARASRARAFDVIAQVSFALLIVGCAPYWFGRERRVNIGRGFGITVGVLLGVAIIGLILRSTTPDIPALWMGVLVALSASLAPAPSVRTRSDLLIPVLLGAYACYAMVQLLVFSRTPIGDEVPRTYVLLPAVLLLLLAWPFYHALPRHRVRSLRQRTNTVGLLVLLPGACALSAMRVNTQELGGDWVFWALTVGAGLMSSDLRWYTLSVLLRTFGRAEPYTDAERAANAGGGVVQAIIAIVAHQSGLVDDRLLGALLIGGAIGEMTVALRRRIARAMERGEPIVEIFDDHDAR